MRCKDCNKYFRNPHELCPLAEMEKVDGNSKACEDFVKAFDYDDEYTPSATNGDYSPSHPWDAPGMSIRDFI